MSEEQGQGPGQEPSQEPSDEMDTGEVVGVGVGGGGGSGEAAAADRARRPGAPSAKARDRAPSVAANCADSASGGDAFWPWSVVSSSWSCWRSPSGTSWSHTHSDRRDSARSSKSVPGESMSSIASQLAAHHVIGSTLAFRLFNLVHGSPTVLPGDYALHGNETFAQVRAALAAGPNIYAVTIHRGLTLPRGGRRRSMACQGMPPEDSPGWPTAVPSIRSSRPPARTTSKACWARGPTSSCPGRATPRC